MRFSYASPGLFDDDASSFIGSVFTASSTSTVPGPGAITGKFLKIVGERSLDLVVSVIIRRRLASIKQTVERSPQILSNPLTPKESKHMDGIYSDLEELCHDCYSISIRRDAAKLIWDIELISRPTYNAEDVNASPTHAKWQALMDRVQGYGDLLPEPAKETVLDMEKKASEPGSGNIIRRSSTVSVRRKRLPVASTWIRQSLVLTNRTISLHSDAKYCHTVAVILLRNIFHIGRVDVKAHCMRIEQTEGKHYDFAFESNNELYAWLSDIKMAVNPISKPTNILHLTHVACRKDEESQLVVTSFRGQSGDSSTQGLPEQWLDVSLFLNDAQMAQETPKECFSEEAPSKHHETISHQLVRSASPESYITHDDQDEDYEDDQDEDYEDDQDEDYEGGEDGDGNDGVVIMMAQRAARPSTQELLNLGPGQHHLKVAIPEPPVQSSSADNLLPVSETSAPTDLTSLNTSPRMQLKESPYGAVQEHSPKDLSSQVHVLEDRPITSRTYTDVCRAQLRTGTESTTQVAVKVLRVLSLDHVNQITVQSRLHEGLRIWTQLSHKNVVHTFGFCDGFGPLDSIISPWYEKGDITMYLRDLGDEGTMEMRLALLTQVAFGLSYLHGFSTPVVHGDLRGHNILINDEGEAILADYGMSSVLEAVEDPAILTISRGSVRWMAPEILQGASKTCACDTYAYGSLILEVLTGAHPYSDISRDTQVMKELFQGRKPKRPLEPTIDTRVWDLIEDCWNTNINRPSMVICASRMETLCATQRGCMTSEPS